MKREKINMENMTYKEKIKLIDALCKSIKCRAIFWSIEDVLFQAKEDEIELTEEEAEEVLETCIDNMDCEYGISWSSISSQIEFSFPEKFNN